MRCLHFLLIGFTAATPLSIRQACSTVTEANIPSRPSIPNLITPANDGFNTVTKTQEAQTTRNTWYGFSKNILAVLAVPNAASCLRKYFEDFNGADKAINPVTIMKAIPRLSAEMLSTITDEARDVYHDIKDADCPSSQSFTIPWTGFSISKSTDSLDWALAIGKFSYAAAGVVTTKDVAGVRTASLKYKVYIYDRYDFNPGEIYDFYIAQIDASKLKDTHLQGLAREFNIFGESSQQSVSPFDLNTLLPTPK